MGNKSTWDLLKEECSEFPFVKCINATNEQISDAESAIGLNFSEPFKFFLNNYEASSVGELRIYTLTKSKDTPSFDWSVVDADRWFKKDQKWPGIEDWYIVANDGSGNPIGINPKGEVWISYHDSGFEQEKLADDFEEFLYKLLTETLW